jgi:hypothetical protein
MKVIVVGAGLAEEYTEDSSINGSILSLGRRWRRR